MHITLPVHMRVTRRVTVRIAALAGILLLLGVIAGRRAAAVHAGPAVCSPAITVINSDDSGAGSLRQATLDICAAGTITFDAALDGQTIDLTSGQLALNSSMVISSSHAIAVSAGGLSRVIDVGASGVVTIIGLTIRDGYLQDGVGAGIHNAGTLTLTLVTVSNNQVYYTLNGSGQGGGIANYGTLAIIDSSVRDNSVTSPNAGGDAGGILNRGGAQLRIIRSTISGNVAGPFGNGGGLHNENSSATIENSTFSGNAAGSARNGGGISNDTPPGSVAITVVNSTIVGNTAGSASGGGSGGGIITGSTGNVRVVNTIIAGNHAWISGVLKPNDVQNQLASGGHNLIGVNGGYTWDASDLTGSLANPLDPDLGPLGNNGGPTLTHLPNAGSPVIDAGDNAQAAGPTDQRGNKRIWDSSARALTVDIGAVEYLAPLPVELTMLDAFALAAGGVRVTWETASEIDSAGFNVLRSRAADGSDRVAVNGALIAATGSNGLGASYLYDDTPATAGTWHYWLEEIDTRGGRTLYGPLAVDVISAPTAVTLHGVGTQAARPLWGALLLVVATLVALFRRVTPKVVTTNAVARFLPNRATACRARALHFSSCCA